MSGTQRSRFQSAGSSPSLRPCPRWSSSTSCATSESGASVCASPEWSKPGPPCRSSSVGRSRIVGPVRDELRADHLEEDPRAVAERDPHASATSFSFWRLERTSRCAVVFTMRPGQPRRPAQLDVEREPDERAVAGRLEVERRARLRRPALRRDREPARRIVLDDEELRLLPQPGERAGPRCPRARRPTRASPATRARARGRGRARRRAPAASRSRRSPRPSQLDLDARAASPPRRAGRARRPPRP